MSSESTTGPISNQIEIEIDPTNALRGSNERVIQVMEDPNSTAADVQNAINESDVRASQATRALGGNAVKGTRKVTI